MQEGIRLSAGVIGFSGGVCISHVYLAKVFVFTMRCEFEKGG